MNNHPTPPQQRHGHATAHHPILHPPFISNSLAIRQEIQRFESVHPSIYAIYDLIDLLPDAQIAQQIRDHVVCIEDPTKFGWILNTVGKKKVRAVIDTLPCGWPQYGIPPLAPYHEKELILDITKSFFETFSELIHFQIDGLENMVINKLQISYTFSQKVKYNFTFPKITIRGRYITDTLLNLMKDYGISIRYEGHGDFVITLENLTMYGSFKYKMPIIFGSIKIYKFDIVVTLGNCVSEIDGLMGDGKANYMINDNIEDFVLWSINGNQDPISTKIEQILVPIVNAKLKGHNIWSLLGSSGGSSTCVPPPDPWA